MTVRLLDPPLHEFLPDPGSLPEGSPERRRVEQLQEANPMLGTRGVRLGLLFPALYEMQVRALFAAAARVPGSDIEVMIPLVAYERELELMRGLIERVAAETGFAASDAFKIGTMIELPRACLQADRIAAGADFFSFGTNDLTQTALGFSRDDIEGRLLARYIDLKILDRSPFETLDTPGVGQLIRMGAWLGRKVEAAALARRLRRARRRPRLDRVPARIRDRLRLLLALPGADRAGGRRAGGDPRRRATRTAEQRIPPGPLRLDLRERRDVAQERLDLEAAAGRVLDQRHGVEPPAVSGARARRATA